MTRKTKIIATIGPASEGEAMLERLIMAGMNVARLNFSHASHAEHARRIELIRKVSKRLDVAVGILQDLQGPKIRVGNLETPLQLSAGEEICLYPQNGVVPTTRCQLIPVDFREIFDSVNINDKLFLDDGRLTLKVISVERNEIRAEVLVGGVLLSHKGINLPGVRIRIPGFTEKDKRDLAFGISQGVDAVAISFVRSSEDVRFARMVINELAQGARHPLLIAKIEKPEALEELDEILDVVDGVMVARGD
ncbi:MAG: pyruvate kinase, partial [Anaerolineales bacterium]|nr:pyruvate kinase [Anaerolineales bacterium]